MPLKLTNFDNKGQVAALNRWADWIETQLTKQNTKVLVANQSANTAIQQIATLPPAQGDGLTHGAAVWETDPAYVCMREDFLIATGSTPGSTGTSLAVNSNMLGNGWTLQGALGPFSGVNGGVPPNLGQIWWSDINTASNGAVLLPNILNTTDTFNVSTGSAAKFNPGGTWALFDNPGWKVTFIFKHDVTRIASSFNITPTCTYVGLMDAGVPAQLTSTRNSNRPNIFIGARLDPTVGQGPFTLTAAANAASSTTVYTGTITSGGTAGLFVGAMFDVTGFTNPANNGTFQCTAVGATSITLTNPNGVAETHTGSVTMTGGGPADSTWVLEVVGNPLWNAVPRNNTQGTTLNTGVSAVPGVWHRLDVVCNTAGSVTLTFDGTQTLTAPVPTMTLTSAGNWCTQSQPVNFQASLTWTALTNPGSTTSFLAPFAPGSKVTVSGCGGSFTYLNGTQTVSKIVSAGSVYLAVPNNAVGGSNASNVTISGYPAVLPMFMFGEQMNVTGGGQAATFVVDYCSLVWNPKLGAGGTPDSTKARYW